MFEPKDFYQLLENAGIPPIAISAMLQEMICFLARLRIEMKKLREEYLVKAHNRID